MDLSNNLTALNYLIYNPFIINEDVIILLKDGREFYGKVRSLIYNTVVSKIFTTVLLILDNQIIMSYGEYISIVYDLKNHNNYFMLKWFDKINKYFNESDIESITPLDKNSKDRIRLRRLFECNYICRFKNTELCNNCVNFIKLEKELSDEKLFLLGDRVILNSDNCRATLIYIKFADLYNLSNSEIRYAMLPDDRNKEMDKLIYKNGEEPYHNLSYFLRFTRKISNHYSVYDRVGYLKDDKEYYCSKCIFQDCNKCLVKRI